MYGTYRISCAVLDQGDPAAAAARSRLLFPDVVYEMVVDLNPRVKGGIKHLVALSHHSPSAAVPRPLGSRVASGHGDGLLSGGSTVPGTV